MLVTVIAADDTDRAVWTARLTGLGTDVRALAEIPPPGAGASAILLLVRPAPATVGRQLAALADHPDFATAVVLVAPGETADLLDDACRIAGAILLAGHEFGPAHLALARLAAREIARRRPLEQDRDDMARERLTLRDLSPVAETGQVLTAGAGQYRAQRLLAAGPALVLVLAIDNLAQWRAGYGRETTAATIAAVEQILVEVPAALGQMLHRRGDGGWSLWLAGAERASASAAARNLLDAVIRAGLRHAPGRGDGAVTLSAGIALARCTSAEAEAEAAAEASLRLAASLGGNRIRWAEPLP